MANELNSAQIDALLDLLSSDDDYRALFVRDLGKALERLPGKPGIPANVTPGSCLRPSQLAGLGFCRPGCRRLAVCAAALWQLYGRV